MIARELTTYIVEKARKQGFLDIDKYEWAALNWREIANETDLPEHFNYMLDWTALERAIEENDPRILHHHINARLN